MSSLGVITVCYVKDTIVTMIDTRERMVTITKVKFGGKNGSLLHLSHVFFASPYISMFYTEEKDIFSNQDYILLLLPSLSCINHSNNCLKK